MVGSDPLIGVCVDGGVGLDMWGWRYDPSRHALARAVKNPESEPRQRSPEPSCRFVELGLVECLDDTDLVKGRLVVRSLKRSPWEPHDTAAAARAARKRQGDQSDEASPNTSRE